MIAILRLVYGNLQSPYDFIYFLVIFLAFLFCESNYEEGGYLIGISCMLSAF